MQGSEDDAERDVEALRLDPIDVDVELRDPARKVVLRARRPDWELPSAIILVRGEPVSSGERFLLHRPGLQAGSLDSQLSRGDAEFPLDGLACVGKAKTIGPSSTIVRKLLPELPEIAFWPGLLALCSSPPAPLPRLFSRSRRSGRGVLGGDLRRRV